MVVCSDEAAMVESVSELPVVLVVSTRETSDVQEKILSALRIKQGDAVDPKALTWVLVTNYYRAKVQLEFLQLPEETPQIVSESGEDDPWGSIYDRNIQSVIYYIEDAAEFSRNQPLPCFVMRCQSECDSLEAGFILHNSKLAEIDDAEKMDKSIEDGMLEYLQDDLKSITAEDKHSGSLLAQDEKQGIERLIEGLQLIPWSSMERQERPRPAKLSNAALDEETKADGSEKKVVQAEESKVNEEETKGQAPQKSKVTQLPEARQSKPEQERAKDEDDPEVQKRLASHAKSNGNMVTNIPMFAEDEPLSEMEKETESLMSLMQEIKAIQEQSKVKDVKVSDEERRRRAEEMIMKLAGMMDLGDDDYGEEGEGEDEWEKLKSAAGIKESKS